MKRPFILFEIMIALGLSAILLTVLFRFMGNSARMDQRVDEARATLVQQQHFQIRLTDFLTSIVPRVVLPPSSGSSFYTVGDKTLIAIFDNGIDPDPAFSGPIFGKLFIDQNANLSLMVWPLEKTEKNVYRTEVLWPHVQNIRFQFLAKKNFQDVDSAAVPINATLEWRTNWPFNRWDIPSMIRITVKQENQELPFAFSLPFLEPIVTYHAAGGKG